MSDPRLGVDVGGAADGAPSSGHPSLGTFDRRSPIRPVADRPPETLDAGVVLLRRHTPADRVPLVDAVNRSLDELRPWMPWAQAPADDDSIGAFLDRTQQAWEEGVEFAYAMLPAAPPASSPTSTDPRRPDPFAADIVGACGLHLLADPGAIEIGYWVRSDCTGAGVATAAARSLTEAALALHEISRVEIHCDAENRASRAIPAKLGYRLERIDDRPPGPRTPGATERQMVWVYPG